MRSTIMDFDLENVEYEDLNDIYNEIATLLGLDAAIAIYNKFRGTQVSFPLEMLSKKFVFRQIRNDYVDWWLPVNVHTFPNDDYIYYIDINNGKLHKALPDGSDIICLEK